MTYIRPKYDFHKFTLISYSEQPPKNINEQLQWLGSSFGLFNLRDKDSSCFRVFIELIKHKDGITAEELSKRVNLSRATTIHHLNKLIDSGIAIYEKKKYRLRAMTMSEIIDEITADINATLLRIKEIAQNIDGKL